MFSDEFPLHVFEKWILFLKRRCFVLYVKFYFTGQFMSVHTKITEFSANKFSVEEKFCNLNFNKNLPLHTCCGHGRKDTNPFFGFAQHPNILYTSLAS